jgi:hypothetical protein
MMLNRHRRLVRMMCQVKVREARLWLELKRANQERIDRVLTEKLNRVRSLFWSLRERSYKLLNDIYLFPKGNRKERRQCS